MFIDYHIHNHFSPDSEAQTQNIINKAIKENLKYIALTNHAEWFIKGEGVVSKFNLEEATIRFKNIKKEIQNLSKINPQINIAFGTEIQYGEKDMKNVDIFIEQMNFDFILGSIHNLDNINIASHIHARDFFKNKNEDIAYNKYFKDMLKLVSWGNIDSIAHFDIIKKYGTKKYGKFEAKKYKNKIKEILKIMKSKNIAMEINTGSVKERCKDIFPSKDILEYCLEIGLNNFTIGSDAHKANQIGQNFNLVEKILKELNIKKINSYKNRKAKANKI